MVALGMKGWREVIGFHTPQLYGSILAGRDQQRVGEKKAAKSIRMRKGGKWLLCGQGPDFNTPIGTSMVAVSTSLVCTYMYM